MAAGPSANQRRAASMSGSNDAAAGGRTARIGASSALGVARWLFAMVGEYRQGWVEDTHIYDVGLVVHLDTKADVTPVSRIRSRI